MRYLILIGCDPGDWEKADQATRDGYFQAHLDFEAYVAAHGRKIAGAALADADTATTLTHTGGEWVVTDGPFVELAEQIGGYYEVELDDLDTALAAAKILPDRYTLEVRPVIQIERYEGL